MNQFIKFVFASCLGFALAAVALFFLSFVFLAIIGSAGGSEKVSVEDNSVLHLTFNNPIPEQTNNLEMNPFDFGNQEILGLEDVEEAITHAATDDQIKGIYLELEHGISAGVATAATVRDALEKFKESGKFVIAYSNYYTQGAYYLASVADTIYLNPLGGIDLHGMSVTMPFFKKMLDKIGVKMQVFYAGDFKGATEPYRLEKMTDENRLQLREYIEPVFTNYLTEIAESREKSLAELRTITNELKAREAENCLSLGLIDATGYSDDVIASIRQRLGLEEKAKVRTVSLEDYASSYSKKNDYSSKDRIALVYAEGAIYDQDGEKGTISDDKYVKLLRKIREDEKYKAIVLRVNSPGGSALASENIWRELNLAKQAGKKVVVSMGDYAASGGYYIACMGDKILAEPNTLTGSIGVFSMIPNAHELFSDKIGITFDTVKTTRYSTGINAVFEMTEEEKALMQRNTMSTYEKFLARVAEGRKMSRDDVHNIAQGRVWVGEKAKELGLVDEIGDLDRAVAVAAELAGIEKYRLTEYPFHKQPLQDFLDNLTGQGSDEGIEAKILEKELGGYYPYFKQAKEMLKVQGVQARLPVFVDFK